MWRTSEGERVLEGAEARLFVNGLRSLLDFTAPPYDADYETGAVVFDQLTTPEKMAILDHVSQALLKEDIPCPPVTAVAEAAIGAVFYHIKDEIRVEIERGRIIARRWVRDALLECGGECPPLMCEDFGPWDEAVEFFMDQILWDRDWEEDFLDPDDPPEEAAFWRYAFLISPDYYTAVPPDPNPKRLEEIMQRMRSLWGA